MRFAFDVTIDVIGEAGGELFFESSIGLNSNGFAPEVSAYGQMVAQGFGAVHADLKVMIGRAFGAGEGFASRYPQIATMLIADRGESANQGLHHGSMGYDNRHVDDLLGRQSCDRGAADVLDLGSQILNMGPDARF